MEMLKGDFTQEDSYTAMFYVANIKYALCSGYTEYSYFNPIRLKGPSCFMFLNLK
jgi:hypothetical protein